MKKIKVSGWNNGKHHPGGNGYGIRVGVSGREYFSKERSSFFLSIENSDFIEIKLTGGFWRNCTEFRDKRIGKWLLKNRLAPWRKGENPKFYLTVLGDNKFILERQHHFNR